MIEFCLQLSIHGIIYAAVEKEKSNCRFLRAYKKASTDFVSEGANIVFHMSTENSSSGAGRLPMETEI